MTPVEIDNYVKCLATLKIGDMVRGRGRYNPNENVTEIRTFSAVVIAKDQKDTPVNGILYLDNNQLHKKEVSLVVLGANNEMDEFKLFYNWIALASVSRHLVERTNPSAEIKWTRFKTLDSQIIITRIIKSQ